MGYLQGFSMGYTAGNSRPNAIDVYVRLEL